MDYMALGATYRATMSQPQRAAAFNAAGNKGDSLDAVVTITVKDGNGSNVVLTMQQDQWLAFLAGFQPL